MLEYYRLYLLKSKREVKIEISVPRNRDNIEFDTLYLLDGQNAFKDSYAAFGRSIRATKCLSHFARYYDKRIIGVAIHNSESDLGRINEYSPFVIKNGASDDWKGQNVKECYNFCDDFISTIIPFIDSKYNTIKNKNRRFIYGSSLAAVTALYLGFKYPDAFNYIGAFSTASFLYPNEFMKFLNDNKNPDKNIFLYVGGKEKSDSIYEEKIYLNTSIELKDYFKNNGNRVRLVIDPNGAHNEEAWGNHLFDLLNFIYFDDETVIISR